MEWRRGRGSPRHIPEREHAHGRASLAPLVVQWPEPLDQRSRLPTSRVGLRMRYVTPVLPRELALQPWEVVPKRGLEATDEFDLLIEELVTPVGLPSVVQIETGPCNGSRQSPRGSPKTIGETAAGPDASTPFDPGSRDAPC